MARTCVSRFASSDYDMGQVAPFQATLLVYQDKSSPTREVRPKATLQTNLGTGMHALLDKQRLAASMVSVLVGDVIDRDKKPYYYLQKTTFPQDESMREWGSIRLNDFS